MHKGKEKYLTPEVETSKEKLFADAYSYYSRCYFNINDFVKAVNALHDDGLGYHAIAKISGMTYKSLMNLYHRDQVEPHERTRGKANFLIDFAKTIKDSEQRAKDAYARSSNVES